MRARRSERAQHEEAARLATRLCGEIDLYGEVMESQAYAPFVRRVLRDFVQGAPPDAIRSEEEASDVMDQIEAALPAELRPLVGKLSDWQGLSEASEGQASFLLGFAIGRRL